MSNWMLKFVICYSRYLYSQGKAVWKKWKKRYFVLVQVSQCLSVLGNARVTCVIHTFSTNKLGYLSSQFWSMEK